MKKYLCFVAILISLTAFTSIIHAEDASNTSPPISSEEMKETKTPMFKGMHKAKHHRDKDAHKHHKKHHNKKMIEQTPIFVTSPLQKQMEDIDENYQDALHKIAKSNLSQAARNLLITQAEENRDLAIKQLQERAAMCAKHACERQAFRCEILKDKQNRKAVRDVDNI